MYQGRPAGGGAAAAEPLVGEIVDGPAAAGRRRGSGAARPAPLPRLVRVLSWLLALAAVVNVVVDLGAIALHVRGELDGSGFALAVRTGWALLRSIGFLILIRHLRLGRVGAWPLAIVLTVSTAFSAARIAPVGGDPSPGAVTLLAAFVGLTLLCILILVLFRAPSVRAHLTVKRRRDVPTWVVTASVLALSYTALMLVPCLVAAGSLFGADAVDASYGLPLVVFWLALVFAVYWVLPVAAFFLVRGHRWARATLIAVSVLVLATQPLLCYLLLGFDSVIRDAVPIVVAAAGVLYGLTADRATRAFFARPPR